LVKPSPAFGREPEVQSRPVDYGEQVERLCVRFGNVECGPDLLRLLTREHFVGNDVHPNVAGNAKIARALSGTIFELFEP
jgi:hypothetical protein